MKIIDKTMLEQLNKLNKTLSNSINKSTYESELEIFETVQVHTGCGGCFGTQISCSVMC